MDIKPIITSNQESISNFSENLNTNNMSNEDIKTKSISSNINKTLDPLGIIPNGIYKVFRSEKRIKKINISILTVSFIISLISSLLFGLAPSLFLSFLKEGEKVVPWGWYIVPVLFGSLSLTFLIIETIEFSSINKSIIYYREQLSEGVSYSPPFIVNLPYKLTLKQVRRTWLVVAILFYVGLFTLIFWGLKDQKWGLLDFKSWIHGSFSNPDLLVYILCGIMLMVLLLFIIGTIHRKKRIVDVQLFFGNEVMNYSDLTAKKSEAHKFWAKIFFLSILILLVIPIIILLLVKRIARRGK
ncbi:MSC_0882 family membrane protein [Metamycoplasma gateae]|uniref:Uncharacterized protein n=1 Tax=Metamycoplasma gateae TaxID=35769 RepID=A0ABZ2AKA2_9BACT|nr:hypothetical protein V2E26_02035 [Metamycoplasma gateae]